MENVKQDKKSKYVTAYSKQDMKNDEASFNDSVKNNKPVDWSAFSRLMVRDICTNTPILETGYIGDIKIEDVEAALQCPMANWRTILAISEVLMRVSPYYYRMNSLYSNMALFCWWIDLYDVKENSNIDTIKRQYAALAAKLENMHLKHEFSKIMKYLPYQDVFCGLVVENATDFFIQKIDFSICKLFQIQDGLYNFKINLGAIKAKELNAYPDYVQQAYLDFVDGNKSNKVAVGWYTPPADKQICIKLNSQWIYPYPLLIGLVKDILDLDTYKKLKLQSARTD